MPGEGDGRHDAHADHLALAPAAARLPDGGRAVVDRHVPAGLSRHRGAFGAPEGTAQITLASWFAGLAVGQITQGTLADRFGRRGPLMVGLALYTLAIGGCALAPDLAVLTVLRAVAAFGGSASMVIPRAVVRDLADGHAAARLMSQLMLVMGAAPILAPTLGGAVLGVASWHAIFWFAAAHGAVSLLLVLRTLPETLPATRRVRLGLAGLLARYGGDPAGAQLRAHASIGAFGMFGMFAYHRRLPPGVHPVLRPVAGGLRRAVRPVRRRLHPGLPGQPAAAAALRRAPGAADGDPRSTSRATWCCAASRSAAGSAWPACSCRSWS